MTRYKIISIYQIILEQVSERHYPSYDDIISHLNDRGYQTSLRSVQRYMRDIRDEFGIEITYNRGKKGFYVDLEQSVDFEEFMRFLGLVQQASVISETLAQGKEKIKYIQFDKVGTMRGISLLQPVLDAIQNSKKIQFIHHSYWKETKTEYTVRPVGIKQFEGRWYLIALLENEDEFRHFGMDRIFDLKTLSKTFKRPKGLDTKKAYDDIIGLNYSMGEPQLVELRFTKLQAQYITSLPLHPSQTIIEQDDPEYVHIGLFVQVNFELIQKIMTYGADCEVIGPQELRDEVGNWFKAAAGLYQ